MSNYSDADIARRRFKYLRENLGKYKAIFEEAFVEGYLTGVKNMEKKRLREERAKLAPPAISIDEHPGWLNRHTDPLPKKVCDIIVLIINGEQKIEYNCVWLQNDTQTQLGVASSKRSSKRFIAYKHKDSEFIYYKYA